jgi:antitoxin (DNA-binding transcriptional repressor) of toxin-antitoxin stability system
MTMVVNWKGTPHDAVKQVPAGKLKMSCLALINEVQATRRHIVVTKHGKPVVKLVLGRDDNQKGARSGKRASS